MYSVHTYPILICAGYLPADFSLVMRDGVLELDWLHTDPKPTPEDIAAQELPWRKSVATEAATHERNRRIDLISGENPEQWRSHIRNTAAAVDLTLRVALGTATAAEDAALVALKADMDAVELIESKYAALIAEIDACTTVVQVEAIDVTAEGRWA